MILAGESVFSSKTRHDKRAAVSAGSRGVRILSNIISAARSSSHVDTSRATFPLSWTIFSTEINY